MTIDRGYLEKLILADMCRVYLDKQDPDDPSRVIVDVKVGLDEEEYSDDNGGYSCTSLKIKVFSRKQNSDRSKGLWRTVDIF